MASVTISRIFRIVFALAFSVQAHAGPRESIALPPTFAEYVLTQGLTGRSAITLLGLAFHSPADKAYLTSLRQTLAKEDPIVKMKEYHRTAHGFEVTAPNGRSFKVSVQDGALLVNKTKIAVRGSSAERYVQQVTAALKQTYVQNLLREIDPWPRAHASAVGLAYTVTAAAILAMFGTIGMNMGNGARAVDRINAFNRNAKETCANEMKNGPFEQSFTQAILDMWRSEKVIKADKSDEAEPCGTLVLRLKQSYEKSETREIKLTSAEQSNVCAEFKDAIKCGRDFEAQSLKIYPASTTAPAANAGESTTGR